MFGQHSASSGFNVPSSPFRHYGRRMAGAASKRRIATYIAAKKTTQLTATIATARVPVTTLKMSECDHGGDCAR